MASGETSNFLLNCIVCGDDATLTPGDPSVIFTDLPISTDLQLLVVVPGVAHVLGLLERQVDPETKPISFSFYSRLGVVLVKAQVSLYMYDMFKHTIYLLVIHCVGMRPQCLNRTPISDWDRQLLSGTPNF